MIQTLKPILFNYLKIVSESINSGKYMDDLAE